MFGELNAKEMELLLRKQIVGRIGCHAEGVTYIIPISYAYDGHYLYAHTHEGLKISMMRKNPHVCFEVDDMTDMANWQSVVSWGKFEEVNNQEDRQAALRALHKRRLPGFPSATTRLSTEWPFSPADINAIEGIVFRIYLVSKTGRFENNSAASSLAFG